MPVKGDKALIKELNRIKKGLTADDLLTKIGFTAKAEILTRTDDGKDYRDKRFKGYEDSTKEHRKRRGRGVDKVDLQDQRHMLNNIQVKIESLKNIVKLVFGRKTERDKAFYHNETGVGRKNTIREFFALGNKLERKIFKQYEKEIDRLIK